MYRRHRRTPYRQMPYPYLSVDQCADACGPGFKGMDFRVIDTLRKQANYRGRSGSTGRVARPRREALFLYLAGHMHVDKR